VKLLLLIFFIPVFSYSQDSIFGASINSITGVYLKNSTTQINAAYSGDNTISRNKLKFNTNTTYSISYSNKIIANELQQKTNINYRKTFILHVFNYSLTRSITSDHSIGLGFGKSWKYFSLSYATLYQNTNYVKLPHKEVIRHSVRLKSTYLHSRFSISCEYYYQPNLLRIQDAIVYGNTKISLFQNKKINFTISDNINFRSVSSVKWMHTLTIGIGFNFKK
jgi:hypothetical protein